MCAAGLAAEPRNWIKRGMPASTYTVDGGGGGGGDADADAEGQEGKRGVEEGVTQWPTSRAKAPMPPYSPPSVGPGGACLGPGGLWRAADSGAHQALAVFSAERMEFERRICSQRDDLNIALFHPAPVSGDRETKMCLPCTNEQLPGCRVTGFFTAPSKGGFSLRGPTLGCQPPHRRIVIKLINDITKMFTEPVAPCRATKMFTEPVALCLALVQCL